MLRTPKFLFRVTILFFTGLFLSHGAFAIEVTKLNEATVPVNSRSTADREIGLKQALADVIIKNSGTMVALSNPLIAEQLNNPNASLVQYGYVERNGQLMLRGKFEPRSITRILRKGQLPVWGKQRPLVLFWLSANINGERKIVNDASDSNLRQNFSQAANAKGLPIIFPIMDLDDLMTVSESDVRGNFPTNVSRASKRYFADYFVLANMQNSRDGKMTYQLNLFPMDKNGQLLQSLFSDQGKADNGADAVNVMINELTSYFVQQYAIADSGSIEEVFITLHGVNQIGKLVAIEQKIKQLSVVKSFYIVEIKDTSVTFFLDLYGSVKDLQRQLNLEDMITPIIKPKIIANPDSEFQQSLNINESFAPTTESSTNEQTETVESTAQNADLMENGDSITNNDSIGSTAQPMNANIAEIYKLKQVHLEYQLR